jgi:hypothetical protein
MPSTPPDGRALPDGVPVRTIAGRACTDRTGIAAVTGLSERTVRFRGHDDPDFPQPVEAPEPSDAERPGQDWRRVWYALDDVYAYRDQLATRRAELAPPAPDTSGDPAELLDWRGLAQVWNVAEATARRYVYRARAQWTDPQAHPRPLVPVPDHGYDPDREAATDTPADWRWYRRTLAAWPRPGRGSSGGRRPAADG